MQDFLALAATVTAASFVGFIVVGYPLYVWTRTAPIAAAAPVSSAAPQVEPVIAAAIAEPAAVVLQPESVSPDAFIPAKPKRGRPRKVAAASTPVLQDAQAPTHRKRRKAA